MAGRESPRRRLGAAALFMGAALVAAVAAPAERPAAPERAFSLRIEQGRVPEAQGELRVLKGDTVRVTIASDEPGEVHLHGYRLAARVAPGMPAHWRFVAHATGRYRLEWHGAGKTQAEHHGPALATLEVHPR